MIGGRGEGHQWKVTSLVVGDGQSPVGVRQEGLVVPSGDRGWGARGPTDLRGMCSKTTVEA